MFLGRGEEPAGQGRLGGLAAGHHQHHGGGQ